MEGEWYMGVYIVTGGSGGIGGKTVDILKSQGHEVVNVDLKNADICGDLSTKEGQDKVINTIREKYPDGIDGLCCNAGVSGTCGNLKLIISLNYFGAVNLALGLFDLLKKKKGICFDYAALMTGMLRSQGVPCKLVVGYAGTAYHAWISVWVDGKGWIDNVIYFDGTQWKRMDPTFASGGNKSKSIMKYIGDGKNYTAKYFY